MFMRSIAFTPYDMLRSSVDERIQYNITRFCRYDTKILLLSALAMPARHIRYTPAITRFQRCFTLMPDGFTLPLLYDVDMRAIDAYAFIYRLASCLLIKRSGLSPPIYE